MKIRGFTLFEILIALFILAIISVIMIRALQVVIDTRNSVEIASDRVANLQIATTIIANDIQQIVNRPISDTNGLSIPPVTIDNTNQLSFTRGGFINPEALQQRSTLERVDYQLDQGNLIRASWPTLDRAPNNTPQQQILLTHIRLLKWSFLASDRRFYSAWPATGSASQEILPIAIEMDITFENGEQLNQLFLLAVEASLTTNLSLLYPPGVNNVH